MTPFSLRSLLLAAIVLSNCISWTASRHHYTHNVSGHRSRHRRQGAGLFLSGSYVLPGGEGTGWGEWGEHSPCSRTCGGGVASQKRICLQIGPDGVPQCTGGDTKYFTCYTQDCPAGSRDFREQQCSEFDNEVFRDVKYKWVPYKQAPNPCELNCMPHGERFYYQHRPKVVDGTRCNDESFDVCVNGTCQPVGCDMMLGSSAREDKCRECRGSGTNCQTTVGVIDTNEQTKGYNDMFLIPEGATNIVIAERAPSRNYLAIRAKNGTYYLNGEYQIDFPRSLEIGGALWYYERNQQGFAAPDKLRCLGPTNEPLIIALLLQDDNVGVEYEYSVPNERAPPKNKQYNWVTEEFTHCSAPCGGGYQTRNVTCRSREELELVNEALCDKELKPTTNQTCNPDACEAQWTPTPWGECSKRCGIGGTRSRAVHCTQIIRNGYSSIVGEKTCFDIHGPKPELHQTCNENATCPIWFTGPWKPCDKLCDEGKQKRQVICFAKNGSRKEILSDKECEDEKPATEQPCMLQPCTGVDWTLSQWRGCDSCLSTVRTRTAICMTKAFAMVNESFCAYHAPPVTEEPCDKTKLPPCDVQWYATQWSKCSVDCGKGVQTRKVFCGLFDGASVLKVDDSRCAGQPKYNDTKDCEVPQDKCPSKWFATPWDACSVKCGGGMQYRDTICLRGGKPATDCSNDTLVLLYSEQSCNTGPCDEDELIGKTSSSLYEDYYEDCIEDEEEFPEVGLDSDGKSTVDGLTMLTTMMSDTPTEGSGMWTGSTAEHESTFDTSSTLDEFLMTSTGGISDFDTESSGSGDDTTDTIFTDDSSTTDHADTGSTTSTISESSGTGTGSTDTEKTGSTVTGSTTLTIPESTGTGTGSTDTDMTGSTVTGVTYTSSSEDTSTTSGETASTVTGETGSTEYEETDESGSTETGSVPTTVSGETSGTETTGSEGSTLSSESGSTVTSESGSTTTSESGSTVTKETGSTVTSDSESTETSESGSTVTSESEPTVTSVSGSTGTSESESTVTSESGPTTVPGSEPTESSSSTVAEESTSETGKTSGSESTMTTESGATELTSIATTTGNDTAETVTTTAEETVTTETSVTESTKATETSETSSTDTTETGSTDTTESGSTDTTETGSTDTETSSTDSTDAETSTDTTETGSTDTSETSKTGSTESPLTTNTDITETSEISSTGVAKTTGTGTTESPETTEADSTVSAETSEAGSTESTETTEAGSTVSSETTEGGITESTETTEAGSTVSKETTVAGSTESTETTEAGSTVSSETTEAGSTKSTETSEAGSSLSTETTEAGSTDSTETSEAGSTVSTETTEAGSTKSTETTEARSTESTETTEASSTVSTETTEAGSTVSTETTETGSTESTKTTEGETTETTYITETETTEATATTETGSMETTKSYTGSTESTVTGESDSTKTTEEGSTLSSEGTESESSTTEASSGTTRWELSSTVEVFTTKKARVCKPRSCVRSEFGCCPDKKTPALGPFDEGCVKPETCLESLPYRCCPDGVSPAKGPMNQGCPLEPCAETFFGCCNSDNKTAAEGNDQEGCPPPPPACLASTYGCCDDETEAQGPNKEGCPETSTTVLSTTVTSTAVTEEGTESVEESTAWSGSTEAAVGCIDSEFGCCFDNETAATGPELQGCPCNSSLFGCCPDGIASAQGSNLEGCVKSCNTSEFGCCPDGKTPAHGHDHEGCCLLQPFGCCRDNYKPADGPHQEGCGCQYSHFGCCPDNVTVATGPSNKGCGCKYSEHGCCPDRHSEASGPEFEGCMCHTYQFGCCPDGVTIAQGANGQGCYCQQSQFGCCGDEQTHAKGPNRQGCNCATSKHGCCLDGVTEATGPKFQGCTDKPLDRQAACSLKFERGPCHNYSVSWFYDTEYGGCSRFWYGGCEGNGNRFSSKEECEATCVSPPPKEACRLPQIKGACLGYNERWYYDTEREMCSNFLYGGCLGNSNNFVSRQLCQEQCEPERAIDQCNLSIERGSCAGNYLRWGFNKDTRICEQFVWGGCEGNSNRFSTEAACRLRCNPPGKPQPECSKAQDVGKCNDTLARWSFSQTENRCVPFYYTGCDEGNGNNYPSREDCQQACPSSFEPELCTLPASTGDCYEYRSKWYFDTKSQRCEQFYYGGCGGNENRFDSEQECVNRCDSPSTSPAPRAPTAAVQPAPGSEFCFMEIDVGPCNQIETKWGYDSTRGQCVSFQYGGCGGNQNNFPSEDHCTYYCKPTQDICQLPMLSGPCDESVMRWFYDAASDSCSQFTYGGCEGNDNRFGTREECENRCKTGPAPSVSSTTTTTAKIEESSPSECVSSAVLEQCSREAVGEVWYYDTEASACKAHENLESGVECRTTGVFYSQEACERSCGVFRNIDVCQYAMEPGPCHNYRSKYYYNKNTSRCEEFAYGGCFGGANRFSTEQECEQICMATVDPCTLPAEPGNCVGHMVMWYFHQGSDQCYQFVFGGCGGNDNKFESREACEGRCRKQLPVTTTTSAPNQTTSQPPPVPAEECRTPESLTPCGSNETVFYFDEAMGRCQAANIGGCGSSINLYRSEEECERRCGAFRGIDVCRAGLDPGPCRASFPKFYFDAASGSCRDFTYGGCQGGANRFSTIEECEEVCASAGPEPPSACASYTEECTALESTCVYGLKIEMTPEGCNRCECEEPPNCDAQQRECDTMRCRYGMERTTSADGCESCKCLDDPCSKTICAPTERCVVVPSRDPDTQEARYSAHCESNEIVDCDAFTSECSRLQCPYGVQRTRMGRCERCSCVREETNCTLLHQECERLMCHYGINRTMGDDGCERCMCLPPPCQNKRCPEGERCVSAPFRDPVTRETRYSAICKTVNKPGVCPAAGEPGADRMEGACRQECQDDAECRGLLKCCARGCSRVCHPPEPSTTPSPSTTHTPDVPRAPEAYTDTERSRPQVDATEGNKATLRCYFHGNPPPKITWRFGEVSIDSDAGRYRLLSDGALEIVSLFRNDSGVYICVAQNEYGSAQQQVTLTVADPVATPAAIAGAVGPVTGELGRPLVVRCQAYGYPPPTIYWYRGHGNEMVPYSNALYEARGQELQIRLLTVDTIGEYECQAYNGEGKPATWRVVVQAYRPPGDTRRNQYLVEREVVVTPRAPAPNLPMPLTTTEEPFLPLYTVPVQTSLPATSSVNAGAQLSLPCEVDGYPEPEVRWTKDNAPIPPSDRIWIAGSRLTIERAEVSDSGVYSCLAANAYSSHSSAVRVSVQEVSIPASCVDNPTFANCALIVHGRFCIHKYYSKFCCKSCVEAGQLDPRDALMQADQSFDRK